MLRFIAAGVRRSHARDYVEKSGRPPEGSNWEMSVPERFYFDVENDRERIRDAVGVEAESLEEALAEARSVIDEMAGSVGTGETGASWTLVVRDAAGSVVGRLPIRP